MSIITSAYIVGNNGINSEVLAFALSDSGKLVTANYQWYKSLTYDGIYESIPYATRRNYTISPDDRYIKCEVRGLGEFTNSVFTNTLVVNQLEIYNLSKNRNNTKLSNIGKGLSYEQLISQVSGSSNVVYDIARINQSIRIILSTAKGEIPMIPDLGTNLHIMLFEGADDDLVDEIIEEVTECLSQQEPRIDIISVDAEYDDDHTIYVTVNYSIKNTNIQSQYIHIIEIGGEDAA